MIISHKRKFIFIKTHKTAGTSLEIALSKFCGSGDIITPISPKDEILRSQLGFRGPQNYLLTYKTLSPASLFRLLLKRKKVISFYNHISATQIKEQVSNKIWDTYYKFSVERNPYDKCLSYYHWIYRNEVDRPSFGDFLVEYSNKLSDYKLYTVDGKIAVDDIYQYENLKEALTQLAYRLNLDEPLTLPNAKSGHRSKDVQRNLVLDSHDKNMISKIFSNEIEFFGYKDKY